jgi:hypothetical protein
VQMRPAVLVLVAQSHEKLGRVDQVRPPKVPPLPPLISLPSNPPNIPPRPPQAEARLLLSAGNLAERWDPETPRLLVPYPPVSRPSPP